MKVYSLVLFLAFLIFKESHGWCTECPTIDNLLSNVSCNACTDTYHDVPAGTCVDFLRCSVFASMTPIQTVEYLISSAYTNAADSLSNFSSEVAMTQGIKFMATAIKEFTSALSADPLFNSFIVKDMGNFLVDVDAISDIVKQRSVGLEDKIKSELKQFYNPYIFANRKIFERLSTQCGNSMLCVAKELVLTNRERIANATGLVMAQVMEDLVETVNDIGVYADDNCVDKECPLIKYIWVFRLDILKTLTKLSPYVFGTTRSFIEFITSVQAEVLLTKMFNIMASRFFSGGIVQVSDMVASYLA